MTRARDLAEVISGGSLSITGAFTSPGIDDNADATAITIDSTERVGIGETSPQTKLHIKTADASATADSNSALVIEGTDATRADLQFLGDAGAFQAIYFGDNSDADIGRIAYDHTGNSMRFTVNASEAVRIASNQALAVGTTDVSSGAKFIVGSTDDDKRVFIQGNNQFRLGLKNGSNNHVWLGSGGADNFRVSNSSGSTLLELTSGGVLLNSGVGISNSSPSTALQVGDGTLDKRSTFNPSTAFAIGVKKGSDHGGFIGSGGANIMQFSNSGGGETMRIDGGKLLIGTTGSMDLGFGSQQLSVRTTGGTSPAIFGNTHDTTTTFIAYASGSSYTGIVQDIRIGRAVTNAYGALVVRANAASSSDTIFFLRGDGNAFADNNWNSGGADYAEYFEWSDGNSNKEDRRGYTVVLDGDKIRKSTSKDDATTIIGVISDNPSVVGNNAWDSWFNKYQKDDYASYILNENGERIMNEDFDDTQKYVSRENRAEWDIVGLMGRIRVKVGQTIGDRWIKMKEISDTVHEYLVR